MIRISFVIPCYRSEDTIEKVVDEIRETVAQREGYEYEIVAVNDCSPDGVYGVLKRLAAADPKIVVVNLARNRGKHCAVMAGYAYATGEYIVNLDDDFQSPVCELWRLMEPLESGEYDVSTAEYRAKKESLFKRFGSDVNMAMTSVMLDKPKNLRFENLSVMKRFVMDEMLRYRNPYPYMEGLIFSVTRRIIGVPMEERERADDKASGFTLRKSLDLFANGLTSFSVKPLRIAMLCGVLFAFLGFLYGIVIIIQKLFDPTMLVGYSSIMAVLLFASGLIMLMLGVIGEYVGRIFICINNLPQYVVRDVTNAPEGHEGPRC